MDGQEVGKCVGFAVRCFVGTNEGLEVKGLKNERGGKDGINVGEIVGRGVLDGRTVGKTGDREGSRVGTADGRRDAVGEWVLTGNEGSDTLTIEG